MSLWIPDITPGTTVAQAAQQYAGAGWFVGPASIDTKHPGSLLGKGWPEQTSRDPAVISGWFARWPDAGVFLHLGRSGATGIDVDSPSKLAGAHPEFARIVFTYTGVLQTTRSTNPPVADHVHGTGGAARRSHLLFLTPPGRRISNSNGSTGKTWGEIRGENGVFMVAPSEHTAVDGRYLWERTGYLQPMPPVLAGLLKDASEKADAVTRAELAAARAGARGGLATGMFERGPLLRYRERIAEGAHRHDTLVEVLPWVMREALAGMYPLDWAENQIRDLHLGACADPALGSGAVRLEDEAGAEFDDVAAWALGHARKADPAAVAGAALARTAPGTYSVPTEWREPKPDPFGTIGGRPPDPSVPRAVAGQHRGEVVVSVTTGMRFTWASTLRARASLWLWEEGEFQWIPLGGLVLLGGREGVGKSTLAFRLAAGITRGILPGDLFGVPRSVVIAATEDAWEQTIQPRLIASGADLDRVARVDVMPADGTLRGLSLVEDVEALREGCIRNDVALILLDPLLSTIGATLDTHKDSDVRRALEPLSRLAADLQLTVIGLIHQNKSTGADLLTRLMGSRAFSAVARAVLLCARKQEEQPDESDPFGSVAGGGEEVFVFGQLKSNLGPQVMAAIEYRIRTVHLGHDPENGKPIRTSELVMGETVPVRVSEMAQDDAPRKRTEASGSAVEAAMTWLLSFLREAGKPVPPATVIEQGKENGHARMTLYRAKDRGRVQTVTVDKVPCWIAPPVFMVAQQ